MNSDLEAVFVAANQGEESAVAGTGHNARNTVPVIVDVKERIGDSKWGMPQ